MKKKSSVLIIISILLSSIFSYSQNQLSDTIKYAVILMDFQNGKDTTSITDVNHNLFEADNSIKSFIEEASLGKAIFQGDIFGWISGPEPLIGSVGNEILNCYPSDEAIGAVVDELNIDLDNYYGVLIMVNDSLKNNCGNGISTSGPVPIPTSGGLKNVSRTLFRTKFMLQDLSGLLNSTVAHELIHSFGISFHSNSYICENDVLSNNLTECKILALGNIFDIMGLRSEATHPCVVIKKQLGWIDDNNIKTIEEDGKYRIFPIETPTNELQGIKIPLPYPIQIATFDGNNDAYISSIYVEYRNMLGFDQRNKRFVQVMNNNSFEEVAIENFHGALIIGVVEKDGIEFPYLLDMHPNSFQNEFSAIQEFADAYLLEGERFTILNNEITVSTTSVVR